MTSDAEPTPAGEPTPVDEDTTVDEDTAVDQDTTEVVADEDETPEVSEEEIAAVPVDTEPLERAENAIDEAREAVSKVAQTDSIDEEATGAGELPAFADSTFDDSASAVPEDGDSTDRDNSADRDTSADSVDEH